MVKLIFVIVILLAVGSLLVFSDVGTLIGYFVTYIVDPISSIVQPVVKIFEVFLSYNYLMIVFGVFLGANLLAFVSNKFMGD